MRSRRWFRPWTRTRRCRSSTQSGSWTRTAEIRSRTRWSTPPTSRPAAGGPTPRVAETLGLEPEYAQRHLLHYVRGSTRAASTADDLAVPRPPRRHRPRAGLGRGGGGLLPRDRAAVAARLPGEGNSPLTEHYSVLGPEVTDGPDGEPIARANARLDRPSLLAFDAVVIAGPGEEPLRRLDDRRPPDSALLRDDGLTEQVYLLEDCTSAVVVPGEVDYTDEADAAFARFAEAGMHVARSDTPIEEVAGDRRFGSGLVDQLEPGILAVATPDLRGRAAVGDDDVGGEVVLAADERRADAVRVDRARRGARTPRSARASKPPETTIFTRSNPSASSASRTFRTSRSLTPRGSKSPISVPERRGRRATPTCRAARPRAASPSARATSSAVAHRVVLEVHEDGDVHVGIGVLGELRRGEHRVAAVGGDQRVRHGADAPSAPPRRLRVGRDADLAPTIGPRRTPRSRRRSGRGGGRGAPA